MDTSSPPTTVEPMTSPSDMHRWKVISGILSIALFLCAAGFVVLFQQMKVSNAILEPAALPEDVPKISPQISIAPGMTPLSRIGLQLKIPQSLYSYEPLMEAEVVQPGLDGSRYCLTFSHTSMKDRVPLCGQNDVVAAAMSSQWHGGRETDIFDYTGYVKEGDEYFLNIFSTKALVPHGIAKEMESAGGVKILLIEPEPNPPESEYGVGYMWPAPGYLVAVVNTPSRVYPGLIFRAKIDGGITRQTFEELLLSLEHL